MRESLDLAWDERIYHDLLQDVRVTFLLFPPPGSPMIELVEPAGPSSPVVRFLERGGGLHHICFEVSSLTTQLEKSRQIHDLIVRPPEPAVAFGGRRIAWIYTRAKLLIEYLERAH
jgi:methylmalonyl-CoA/ethylmalonyl-CoA epimerase